MNRLSRRVCLRSLAGLGASATGLLVLDGCGLPSSGVPQPTRIVHIGYLSESYIQNAPATQEALRRGLPDYGWIDGENVAIEWRFTEGQAERLPDLAAELVRLPVDVIVAGASLPVLAAMNATSSIPIVMTSGFDPVGVGLVASLAHPDGNVTGVAIPAISRQAAGATQAGRANPLTRHGAVGLGRS